ncbi:universal stress protein [Flavobacteriaceae bacterium D16]|nr:universal stress protein [Flavobacteriaceae bacterium D16]
MSSLPRPFKKLLFGFAFSPTLEDNLHEATRLAYYFNATLILLHVGEKTKEKTNSLQKLLAKIEFSDVPITIRWEQGKPEHVILQNCSNLEVDLLILGAIQHENLYQFYVGTLARKLTRKVGCSVLLLIKPSVVRVRCQHIVVNGLDAPETPVAITDAFYMAYALGAQQITIVEEIRPEEVQVTVEDDQSLKKATRMKAELKSREDLRVSQILGEIPAILRTGVRVKMQSIFGKRGYSIGHYAEVVRADLLVMNAPHEPTIWDRIFPHDIEYILSDLPTDLLIVRKQF